MTLSLLIRLFLELILKMKNLDGFSDNFLRFLISLEMKFATNDSQKQLMFLKRVLVERKLLVEDFEMIEFLGNEIRTSFDN